MLADLRSHFPITPDIEEADVVILWNDVNPVERGIIHYAHSLKKPVIVMQHGRKGTSKYYPPFNEKIQADKLLVWGPFDRRALVGAGQEESRIKVVGTTLFSHLKGRKRHKGVNVVFCPEHWDRPVEENRKVRDALRKLKGINVITKIIESHNPADFDHPVQSNRDSDDHLGICAEVLATADLVVGISESTFELLAQHLDIPVVIMSEWEPKAFGGDLRYQTYRRVISPASAQASLKTLLPTIRHHLKNPGELAGERRQVVRDEGGADLDSLELIKSEIIHARVRRPNLP